MENAPQIVEKRDVVIAPMVDPQRAKQAYLALRQITKDVLVADIDFGTIEGTHKPTLYKAGAENLLRFYGLSSKIVDRRENVDQESMYFEYTYTVQVFKMLPDGTSLVLAECEGSCSNREKKYYKYTSGEIRDPYDQINTLRKMAQKRAFVGAVLQATGASGLFTQDLEDQLSGDTPTPDTSGQTTQTNPQQPQKQQDKKPRDPSLASDAQLNAIRSIARNQHGITDDAGILRLGIHTQGKTLEQHTRKEASALIDALKVYKPQPTIADNEDPFAFDGDGQQSSILEGHPDDTSDIDDDDLPF